MIKKKIIFITGSRSDYFIQRPILNLIKKNKKFKVFLILTGAHYSKKFGYTASIVKKEKLGNIIEIKSFLESSRLESRALGASIQLNKIIKKLIKIKPTIAIAPYDREESIDIALAATYCNIPVAHLGAGDLTEYNVDGLIRHSVSKLSQMMFTSTLENKNRLIRMGENSKYIFNVGHTSIDRYKQAQKIPKSEIEKFFNISIGKKPLILLIQHPLSNNYKDAEMEYKQSLIAIDKINLPTIIVKPNSDPGSISIINLINKYRFKNNNVRVYSNIPELYFTNLMRYISLLVGNSSMGILDSAFFKIPVVNIGKRQRKRQNSGNVIFTNHNSKKIVYAINFSLSDKKYKLKLKSLKNVYGNGDSSKKIIKILEKTKFNEDFLIKKYN